MRAPLGLRLRLVVLWWDERWRRLVDPDRSSSALLRGLARARSAGRDEEAAALWRELVTRELPRVRGYVRMHRQDGLPGGRVAREDVDDLVHQVFLRIHAAAFEGEAIGQVRRFLASTTRNVCLDHVRSYVRGDRRVAGSLDAEPGDDGQRGGVALEAQRTHGGPPDPARVVAEGSHLHDALEEVDPDKREALLLQAEGYSAREIAARLGLSEANVYQRLTRARGQLQRALEGAD